MLGKRLSMLNIDMDDIRKIQIKVLEMKQYLESNRPRIGIRSRFNIAWEKIYKFARQKKIKAIQNETLSKGGVFPK